jgi:hypothetical protein
LEKGQKVADTISLLGTGAGHCGHWAVGDVEFFGFSISYKWRLIGKTNSKTKVAKAFFFIFMSYYAEMSFFKEKNHKIGAIFCVDMGF